MIAYPYIKVYTLLVSTVLSVSRAQAPGAGRKGRARLVRASSARGLFGTPEVSVERTALKLRVELAAPPPAAYYCTRRIPTVSYLLTSCIFQLH